MSLNRYDKRRDTVEPSIVSALLKAGVKIMRQDEFDLLCCRASNLYMLEVKSSDYKARKGLTDGQQILRNIGWPLQIVTTPEQALKAVGL